MEDRVRVADLNVARPLYDCVRDEIAPGTGFTADDVFTLLAGIVAELGPRHRALLERREALQETIDGWLAERRGRPLNTDEHRGFLERIGYLVPEGPAFGVTTENVDEEIAALAGPQLVVPVDRARYALNAANARWGSLFDALYGTDAIPETPGTERGRAYNPARGERVMAEADRILDVSVPLERGGWSDAAGFSVEAGRLAIALADGGTTAPADPAAFRGYRGSEREPSSILLARNGLHVDVEIDREHAIGRSHRAGVKDVVLEAAVSTIMDCEDSVAAVDAEDKARVYSNWAGIMRGTLTATFVKGGERIERRLNPDREYVAPDGTRLVLPGRSLLLVRHVGAHVLTDAVTTADGAPVFETFLDCVVTALGALHDLNGTGPFRNSRTGSVYVVKPKQHGPDEVAAAVELFARVERGLNLPPRTLKIGIMDEERRTTLNLLECIRAARDRVIFINTGFLDRTGDEIHTHMEAGPMTLKPEIKSARWMLAYEDWNVDVGLEAGLPGHAQIGKGMWAMPAEMRRMLDEKQAHPAAGASCAWVPSPTAATLHAIHYHRVGVASRQRELANRPRAKLADLLTPPLLGERELTDAEIERELENNAQGILGYVVRWVEQGVGCSTVPDVNGVGLMEDRATLRISSQHIANWLHHGIVDSDRVRAALTRMAEVVDGQNASDPAYRPMASDLDGSVAFAAALDLVFRGREQPNGYTEHLLAERRRELKRRR